VKRGQIFTVDLVLALVVVVLALGLITQAWDFQLKQAASTVEQAKMQQIAIDAAAIKYYNPNVDANFSGLNGTQILTGEDASARALGYIITTSPTGGDCTCSTRGTSASEVKACVCRRA